MEDNNNEEKNNSDMDIKTENEDNNKKANRLTGLSAVLIIAIPTYIILINYLLHMENSKIGIVSIKYFTPISILIGITLLVYIRIKYPDNYWSKQLIKICITILFITTLFICLILQLIFQCETLLRDCSWVG